MNKERYDKVLLLMSIDMAYEQDYGDRYVDQEVFDKLLKECGVSEPDGDYIESRIKKMMDNLILEIEKEVK